MFTPRPISIVVHSLMLAAALTLVACSDRQSTSSEGTATPPPAASATEPPAGSTGDAESVPPAPVATATAPAAAPAPAPAPAPRNSKTAVAPPAAPDGVPSAAAPKPAAPQPPPPRVATLRSGMSIGVHTTSTLSTETNTAGELFTATLAEPIVDGDWVIAQRGARVEGVVVDADKGGRAKGVASLSVALRRLTLADGRTIDLQTSTVTTEAGTSKGKDAKRIGIGAGVGAAIGGIAGGGSGAAIGAAVGGGAGTAATLATRGDAAVVPTETALAFVLTSPVSITQR